MRSVNHSRRVCDVCATNANIENEIYIVTNITTVCKSFESIWYFIRSFVARGVLNKNRFSFSQMKMVRKNHIVLSRNYIYVSERIFK